MTYTNTKKLFNFKLVAIGLIFLIDFNVNTIDILPDFIALVFISAGLGKIWYINENFSQVKYYIKIFFVVAFAKFFWNIIYLILGFRTFDSSFILLLATLFSGLEFILSINIFINIFKGLEIFLQLGEKISRTKKSDFIINIFKIFIILKFILTMFTQIPVVITETAWDNLSMIFDTYLNADTVKNLLIPPCFIIQTLIGLFLLSLAVPFFFDIGNDKNFYDSIKSKINYILINDNFFNMRQNLNFAFILFMTGCIFFIDFQIDSINILPDFIICLFFLIGISTVLKINPDIKNKKLNIYLLINLFISIFYYITETVYKITKLNSFAGENVSLLNILKFSHIISFNISVIMFFLIFIEFYIFIINFQKKHIEFSVRYFNKYITLSEKNFDKNKNIVLQLAAFVFCIKILSPILPESGIVIFFHSLILAVFVFFIIRGLYMTREAVYSYYNK